MKEDRFPWFPCKPQPLLATLAQMPPAEGYVYVIVLLRIYDAGGPCPDSLDALVRRTGYNKRVVSDALDKLFQARRLVRVPGGIHNPVAMKVLEESGARREGRSSAGKEGAKRRWEKAPTNQTGGDGKAIGLPMAKNSYLHLQEEEERTLFPIGNKAAGAASDDVRTELFRKGKDVLCRITGRTDGSCRKLIGSWLKQSDEDAVLVLRAIEDAERERVSDPVPWIVRAIESRAAGRKGQARGTKNGAASLLARVLSEEENNVRDAESLDERRALPAGAAARAP